MQPVTVMWIALKRRRGMSAGAFLSQSAANKKQAHGKTAVQNSYHGYAMFA